MKATAPTKSPKTKRRQVAVRGRLQETIESEPLFLQRLFAANVRLVRLARGISQEELADRASLDRTYISSVERRLRNLSIQNVQRLAVALQVDPRELLDPDLHKDLRFQTIG